MKIFGTSMHKPQINSGMFTGNQSVFNSNLITNELDITQRETNLNANVLNFTRYNTLESAIIPQKYTNATPMLHTVDILGDVHNIKGNMNYETMFDISSDVLVNVNRYYTLYKSLLVDELNRKVEGTHLESLLSKEKCAMSLFNDWYGINVSRFELFNYTGIIDEKKDEFLGWEHTKDEKTLLKIKDKSGLSLLKESPDITDCRTSRLIAESQNTSDKSTGTGWSKTLGWELYKLTDFIYCRDAGKISNNRLITLRLFPYPIGDNIKDIVENSAGKISEQSADRGRMLCWLNDDNKLEDILNYNYNTSWKEFNATIQEKSSEEDKDKLLNSIMNLGAPQNITNFSKGFAVLNNNRFVGSGSNSFFRIDAQGPYDMELLTNYDKNEIYEPKDTIRSTHKYEGELKFTHEFELTFDYEMRAYENINPRTAFLDLLANIQDVTYRRGHFWGGKAQVNGTVTNKQGWNVANAIINNSIDKTFGVIGQLMTGEMNIESVWGFMSNALSQLPGVASDLKSAAQNFIKNPTSKPIWKSAKDFVKGYIKNTLGRPAQYAFNSLLSDAPVGLWHVTIGNPFRPILSIGNLIITGTSIQHYGPLGIDDFPTGLKVKVKLKHAMPRDITKIQQMYNEGRETISNPIGKAIDINNYKQVVGLVNSDIKHIPSTSPITKYINEISRLNASKR